MNAPAPRSAPPGPFPPPFEAIGRASPADLPALLAIEEAAFDARIYGRMSARQFRRHIAAPTSHLFVYREPDGEPVAYGLGLARTGADWLRFYSLAVAPKAKGRSLGVLLFDFFEDYARRTGFRRMLLEIRSDNVFLRERYEAKGHTIYREVPEYYPDGSSCLKMAKRLAD